MIDQFINSIIKNSWLFAIFFVFILHAKKLKLHVHYCKKYGHSEVIGQKALCGSKGWGADVDKIVFGVMKKSGFIWR